MTLIFNVSAAAADDVTLDARSSSAKARSVRLIPVSLRQSRRVDGRASAALGPAMTSKKS
jgi:hypothetical protein